MKASAVFLLPLVASAAVIQPRHEHSVSATHSLDQTVFAARRQTAPKPSASPASGSAGKEDKEKTWGDTIGGFLNGAYETWNSWSATYDALSTKLPAMLPDIVYAGVNNLAWYMQWVSKPVKVDQVAPVINSGAKKVILRYGPYTLLGQKYERPKPTLNMDPKSDILIRTLKGLPNNAAILSGRMDTVFEDGSKADVAQGVYIHHLLVADVGKTTVPFAMCPGGHNQKALSTWISSHLMDAIGAGLIQSGNDQVGGATVYSAEKGMKSGFLTGWEDTFLLEAEIVNYNKENTTIYATLELEYLPEKPTGYLDASTVVFSATGCGNPGYRPPNAAKKYNYTSDPFVMNRNGYIINARGHLHDGGTAIQMYLNDKLICHSTPTYTPTGAKSPDGKDWKSITSMSRCNDPVRFLKGDVVKLVSIYDTNEHPLREGAHEGMEGMGGHGDEHGGGMEGMEEMGIFTVNVAIDGAVSQDPALTPSSQQQQQPKQPANSAPSPASAMSGHSHGPASNQTMKLRTKRYGLVDVGEPMYPVILS